MTRANAATYGALLTAIMIAAVLGLVIGVPELETVAIAVAVLIVFVGVYTEAPEIAVLTFMVARPIVDAFVYTSIAGLTLGQVWGLGLIGTTLVYLLTHRGWRIPAVPATLLITYVALTVVRPDLGAAFDSALKLASWLLVMVVVEYIAATRRGQQEIVSAMWATALVLFLVIAVAVSQGRYGSAYYAHQDYGEAIAGYARPHALASLAVLVMPFVLAQIIVGRRTRWSILAAGLLSLGVIASYVRTAYLALLAIFVAYLFAGLRARTARVQVSLAAMAAAFGFALYWFWDDLVLRLVDLPLVGDLLGGSSSAGQGGGSGRSVFWGLLWAYGTETPARMGFGSGAGISSAVLSREYGVAIGAHNDFLEFFITGGVILLGAYVAFLIWIFVCLFRLVRDERQSAEVHASAIVFMGALPAFLVLSVANGIALAAGAVVMAVLIGLVRGMMETPGDTALDAPREADLLHPALQTRPSAP